MSNKNKVNSDTSHAEVLATAACSTFLSYLCRYRRRVKIGIRWNYRSHQLFHYPIKLWESKGEAMSIIIDAIGLLFVLISAPLLIPITILIRLFEPFFVRDQSDETLDKVESRLDARNSK